MMIYNVKTIENCWIPMPGDASIQYGPEIQAAKSSKVFIKGGI